jgi:DNA-binding FadR family transcriptional regulator
VLEAMQAVEPLTARLAAERATPEDIERLRASIAASTAAWADEALFAEAALDFHLLVAEAARSRALRSSVRALRSMQSLKFEVYAAPPRDKRVTHSHEKILAAIEAGDGELAEASMRAHLHTMAENPIYDEAEAKAEIG